MESKSKSLIERAVATVKTNPDYRGIIAHEAAVEPSDVDTLVNAKDPKVMDAFLNRIGISRPKRLVDTSVKEWIDLCLQSAVWDKRLYWSFGPSGCGKTYCTTELIKTLKPPVGYLRVKQLNKRATTSLLIDIHRVLINAADRRNLMNNRTLYARAYMDDILEIFSKKSGVLVVDEAQQLSYRNFELIRDIFDETQLSIVMIGSNAIEDVAAMQSIAPSAKIQFRRRINDVFPLPHANKKDVEAFLDCYGIKLEDMEYEEVAKLISTHADIDTLDRSIAAVGSELDGEAPSWTNVHATDITDAIKRVIDPGKREE